mmetsp:Transcript_46922/g.69430  ORF Transcript_46922/g.69430 Transcript_46922/m.69430 type:complete len:248 (-) Transcript_46922:900-1643(-)
MSREERSAEPANAKPPSSTSLDPTWAVIGPWRDNSGSTFATARRPAPRSIPATVAPMPRFGTNTLNNVYLAGDDATEALTMSSINREKSTANPSKLAPNAKSTSAVTSTVCSRRFSSSRCNRRRWRRFCCCNCRHPPVKSSQASPASSITSPAVSPTSSTTSPAPSITSPAVSPTSSTTSPAVSETSSQVSSMVSMMSSAVSSMTVMASSTKSVRPSTSMPKSDSTDANNDAPSIVAAQSTQLSVTS